MTAFHGKYAQKRKPRLGAWTAALLPLSFFALEGYAFAFLGAGEAPWPLAFGIAWAAVLSGLLWLLPGKLSRVAYGAVYALGIVYTVGQTGYYLLFGEMMWLSDFRYAGEGAAYIDVILGYPLGWWLGIGGLPALGILVLRQYPVRRQRPWQRAAAGLAALAGALCALVLPEAVFLQDRSVQYAGSDYGRAQSAEAAYDNMFNAHRLYQVCGVWQTGAKDVFTNYIYPITPGFALEQAESREAIGEYLAQAGASQTNAMTGVLEGKNVILVLMESMDDWMIGEHTPTIARLMDEGIQFTRFYTPPYGGIRTFNTEFCINTGSFLSSAGGYAFDYVTNTFDQSLASQLGSLGYSAKTFHYNSPSFYSRGVFSPTMGYEEYVCYEDFVAGQPDAKKLLYDDLLLFDNGALKEEFFRGEGKRFNFLITRSAHLSYKYNEVLSHWGLKKYPQYRGLTGSEETDCAYLKARLVDDLFARLLEELEARGELENTVIIGVTDHYTYGYKDTGALMELSGVTEKLLLEKTPCFLWSPGLAPQKVDKVLNTADLLPTVLNLMGVESPYAYMGSDAFDEDYAGFVPFADGSWIAGDVAYDAAAKRLFRLSGEPAAVSDGYREEMARRVQQFIRINNLILETDYYAP